jgi:hypothetical protein
MEATQLPSSSKFRQSVDLLQMKWQFVAAWNL